MRVLVVGPQQLLRESLAFFLAASQELQIIGQIDSDLTRLHFIKASPPHVILVDVDVSTGLNLNLLSAVSQHFPTLPMVVLTACTQRDLLRQLLAFKLEAYLSKTMSGQELVTALLSVTKPGGATIIASALTTLLLAESADEDDFAWRQATLTKRERAILALLLAGKTNQQIAQLLHVNPQTIRNYNREIYTKLGVKTRVDLLLLANRAKSSQTE